MGVLMIGPHPRSRGGISSVIDMYREAGFFKKHGFMASTIDGSISQRIAWFAAFLPLYTLRLLLDFSIDVVHIHLAVKGSVLRKAIVFYLARLAGKQTILHFHGAQFSVFYEKSRPWLRGLVVRMMRQADQVICLNHTCQKYIHDVTGALATVLYNPTCMQKPVRQEDGHVRFLFMGRIGQRKGVYDLIEAARNIDPQRASIHLYGDGEVERARRFVDEAGLSDRVFVHGWISGGKKAEVFRSSQVLVLPSYNEGLPISVLEALAYGLPVISTPVGGIPDAVQDGWNGIMVAPGNANALSRAINRLADDVTLRRAMGQAGYERARERFDIYSVLESLETIYYRMGALGYVEPA